MKIRIHHIFESGDGPVRIARQEVGGRDVAGREQREIAGIWSNRRVLVQAEGVRHLHVPARAAKRGAGALTRHTLRIAQARDWGTDVGVRPGRGTRTRRSLPITRARWSLPQVADATAPVTVVVAATGAGLTRAVLAILALAKAALLGVRVVDGCAGHRYEMGLGILAWVVEDRRPLGLGSLELIPVAADPPTPSRLPYSMGTRRRGQAGWPDGYTG